jgi:uncharacterized damage-inducible protein DinB
MMLEHLRRMAGYNHWADQRLHAACRDLPEAEHGKPRQALFGSLHGTRNHILVGARPVPRPHRAAGAAPSSSDLIYFHR